MEDELSNGDLLKIEDKQLKNSIARIKEAVETIWSGPVIIKDYPEHEISHSERIKCYINTLLKMNRTISLDEQERYLLLASTYLHDIGMQCDVTRFQNIMKRSISLGARFHIHFQAKKSSNYHPMEQIEVRDNHHYLSAAWISCSSEDNSDASALDEAVRTIPPNLLKCLIYLCINHRKLDDHDRSQNYNCKKYFHGEYLASLLRFADELDISSHRVPKAMYGTFKFYQENIKYWWLHEHTDITVDNGSINLYLRINPENFEEYGQVIGGDWINQFRKKNEGLLDILAQYGLSIKINGSIILLNDEKKIPNNVGQALKYRNPNIILRCDIPSHWSCKAKKLKKGDVHRILTDGRSNINIDVFRFFGDEINEQRDYEVNGDVGSFYMKYILNCPKERYPSVGTEIMLQAAEGFLYLIKGISNPFFATNKSNEWVVSWAIREYKILVGIHAIFDPAFRYNSKNIYVGGRAFVNEHMQEPLINVLQTIKIEIDK